jgi:hypothetical protein
MIFPQSIRQGGTGQCGKNDLRQADMRTIVSPWLPGGLEGQGGAVVVAVEVRDSFGAVSKPKTIQVISQWPKLESEAEATAATGALLGNAEAALKAGGPEAGVYTPPLFGST